MGIDNYRDAKIQLSQFIASCRQIGTNLNMSKVENSELLNSLINN